MKRLKAYLTDDHGVYKWEWIVLGLLLLIPFVSFAYADFRSIIHYETNFTGSIFKGGGLQNFYTYCMEKVRFYIDHGIEGTSYATYDFPIYIVLGIWGIPLYIFEQTTGIDPTHSFLVLFYGKSIYIAALIISAYLIYKLCRELGVDSQNSMWGCFGFVSSLLVFEDVCIIGQSDILVIVWILLGMLALLQKREWKFVICFMIAISFKPFAFFIFVPVLLLTDKSIIRIMVKMLAAASLTLISQIPFYGNTEAMEIKKKFAQGMLGKLTAAKLPFLNREIPLVIILLGGLCLFCFLKNELKEDALRKKYIVYTAFLSMGDYFFVIFILSILVGVSRTVFSDYSCGEYGRGLSQFFAGNYRYGCIDTRTIQCIFMGL